MKTKRKISLKWRIFAALTGILALILVLLWLCQTVFLNGFYKTVKVYEAKNAAQEIAAHLYDDDIELQITAACTAHDISVKVLDHSYNTVYNSSGRELPSFFNSIPDSELSAFSEKAQANGGSYSEYFEGFRLGSEQANKKSSKPRADVTSFIIANVVADQTGGYYTVVVNANITPVDSVITTLRVILIVVTVLTVLGALIAALILSAGLTKPLKKLSEEAKELATGDYEVTFEPSSIKEVDELADSLNYAKTELGKIDTLQKELVANISHDLRTPLTLITGYAEVMRDIPGEVTEENLQVIIDESNRLTSLVSDVLDISKFSAGAQKMQPEPVDLVAEINGIIPRYNKLIESDNYHIIFEHGALQTAPVTADSTALLQVLYNLINNAVSYTGEDKTVTIRLEEDGENYTVHILDTGEGIPEDKLPYIWDRYYKVDKNHRRAQMGSGLGLSIVKQILDAHGAAYGVTSTLGEGSDFWFSLAKNSERDA